MNSIISVLKEIEATPGKNDKMAILEQHKNDAELLTVLLYALDPFKVFGIGKKTFKPAQPSNEFEFILDLLNYLLKNPTGSDETKAKVNAFLAAQPEDEREMYQRIILKDLRIGMTETSINKVIPGLIPTFDCQLAHPIEEKKIPNEVMVEPKYDGVRILAVKQNGVTTLRTRNGKVVEGFDEVVNDLNTQSLDNVVFDGEIVGESYKDTMEKLFKQSGSKKGTYMIFDVVPLDEFENGQSKAPCFERRATLIRDLVETDSVQYVKPFAELQLPTIEELGRLMDQAVIRGFEGVVVKDGQAVYQCKRTYAWQKMKPFESEEFIVVDFVEGDGKYKGTLGAAVIDVNGTRVEVGSGWTDAERQTIWANQEKYIGQQLEVQYQEKIEKTGSLRFPVAKGFRYDK